MRIRIQDYNLYIMLVFTYPFLCECLHNNGAAMRVSPVAWAANDLEFKYLLKMAEETAACSHNHPEGIKGAQTVALAIQYGIELHCYHPNFTQEHVKELVESCAKYAGYDINIKKENVINSSFAS